MAGTITTSAKRLRSGTVVVEYSIGRVFGVVTFDETGRYSDATRKTASSTTGRGFVDNIADLPKGVYEAARAARATV